MHNHTIFAAILGAGLSATILAVGCSSSPTSRATTKRSVIEIIESLQLTYPNGVSPEAAQRQMEENGFECTWTTNGTFVHQIRHDDGATTNRTVENIDFIRCKRQTQQGMWVTYFDDVALVVQNGRVVDALSNWSAVGP